MCFGVKIQKILLRILEIRYGILEIVQDCVFKVFNVHITFYNYYNVIGTIVLHNY